VSLSRPNPRQRRNAKLAAAQAAASRAAPILIPQPKLPAVDFTVTTYDLGSWRGRYWQPHGAHVSTSAPRCHYPYIPPDATDTHH
jgi:hypothetical protein